MVTMKKYEDHQFSFIVTCYNFEKYIAECLDSLVCQNYKRENYEVICIDDGSTDNSVQIIEKYRRSFENFSMIRMHNSGLEKACNIGIEASRFGWIVRVDSDDRVDINFLSVINRKMNQRPEYDFYYCKNYFEYFSENERYKKSLPDFDIEEIFERGDFFATGTVYKKSDLKEIGFFPEAVKNCGLENYSVILALLAKNKKGLAVPGTWFDYRRHHTNMSILKRQAIVEFGHKLLAFYERPFLTNENHPYQLKFEAEEQKT